MGFTSFPMGNVALDFEPVGLNHTFWSGFITKNEFLLYFEWQQCNEICAGAHPISILALQRQQELTGSFPGRSF